MRFYLIVYLVIVYISLLAYTVVAANLSAFGLLIYATGLLSLVYVSVSIGSRE